MNTGALSTKQWHCAVNSVSFALRIFSRGIPTRGLPKGPTKVGIYQFQARSVANVPVERSLLRKLQDHISCISTSSTTSSSFKSIIRLISWTYLSLWACLNPSLDSGHLCLPSLLRSGCDRDFDPCAQWLI